MDNPNSIQETYLTEQENFWAGDFGNEYLKRNAGDELVTASMMVFGKILRSAPNINSILELGCNIGLNLEALKKINGKFDLTAYEINAEAAAIASRKNLAKVIQGTIIAKLDDSIQYDLTFTKGVLTHIDPNYLHMAYDNLYKLSKKYIMVCEAYNYAPTSVNYRGHDGRFYLRDYAGELMEKFNLRLVNYGFFYRRENYYKGGDAFWFLLEK